VDFPIVQTWANMPGGGRRITIFGTKITKVGPNWRTNSSASNSIQSLYTCERSRAGPRWGTLSPWPKSENFKGLR
jgi:hypothetical protein